MVSWCLFFFLTFRIKRLFLENLLNTEPHFHAHIDINASNIVGLSSSKTKNCSYKPDKTGNEGIKGFLKFLRQFSDLKEAAFLQTISHSEEFCNFVFIEELFHQL